MARRYYSRAHYRRLADVNPSDDGRGPERVARRLAGERAHQEALARFGGITAANAMEFLAWQDARIKELSDGKQ